MGNRLEEQLRNLPAKPGVYLFRDRKGDVLYIGKAKSLRSRVRSYFQDSLYSRAAIRQLPDRVEDIEVIVTSNQVEALHLEQNLVNRFRPPFNVRLRDDKSFPYIDYHIDRCLAPCVGYVSKEDYRQIVDGVIEFLSGETRPILRELEQKMKDAAAEQRFEHAARYRNRLRSVEHLAERQAADRRSVGTIDVIGLAAEGDRAAVQVFPLRDGKLIDRHSFHLENVGGQDLTTVLEQFCLEYYGSAPSIPPQIVVPRDAGDLSALEEFLSERRGSRVEVRAAERGEKRRLPR